ncbi:MAG: hypothetical protein HY685_06425 [Chloroflexi bacterium]|nr:hypothetical protein [Chloroflexota bacterium]
MSDASRRTRTQKWGWGILISVSAILVLNGVGLYFLSASPTTFEQDTGVPMAEVRQAYPTVADQVVREGQNVSILLTSLGLLALAVAVEGFRHGSRWAWNSTWVLVAWLVVGGTQMLLINGRLDLGGFYLAFAAVALLGQLLARRGLGR